MRKITVDAETQVFLKNEFLRIVQREKTKRVLMALLKSVREELDKLSGPFCEHLQWGLVNLRQREKVDYLLLDTRLNLYGVSMENHVEFERAEFRLHKEFQELAKHLVEQEENLKNDSRDEAWGI